MPPTCANRGTLRGQLCHFVEVVGDKCHWGVESAMDAHWYFRVVDTKHFSYVLPTALFYHIIAFSLCVDASPPQPTFFPSLNVSITYPPSSCWMWAQPTCSSLSECEHTLPALFLLNVATTYLCPLIKCEHNLLALFLVNVSIFYLLPLIECQPNLPALFLVNMATTCPTPCCEYNLPAPPLVVSTTYLPPLLWVQYLLPPCCEYNSFSSLGVCEYSLPAPPLVVNTTYLLHPLLWV